MGWMLKRTLILGMVAIPLLVGAQPSVPKCEIFDDGGFFVGCNYWAKNAGMYMWSQWRPDVIEKDGIKLIVGILTGWMSGRQFVPEVFEVKSR